MVALGLPPGETAPDMAPTNPTSSDNDRHPIEWERGKTGPISAATRDTLPAVSDIDPDGFWDLWNRMWSYLDDEPRPEDAPAKA